MWSIPETPYYNIAIIPLQNQRVKKFNYKGRSIRVYMHKSLNGTYTINAGADSELSHTGSFYPEQFTTIEAICEAIDNKDKKGKLFI